MKRLLVMTLLAGCAATPPAEHAGHSAPAAKDRDAMWKASLARAPLAVAAAFDPRGRLWLARIEHGRLLVSRSFDTGKTFGEPVPVNREPERIAADGENRPKLAFGTDGVIYVSWTQSLETPFAGHVRFARSIDDGRTFEAARTVNDNLDPIGHRFDALLVDGRGDVHLLWLDKRDSAAAQQRGAKYPGISLYHAVSGDRGARFSANRKLAEHSCECCRIALARAADGVPVAVWRHVFDKNTRDHALVRLDDRQTPERVTHEQWAVDACPHHGPALAIGADGVYHLAWYSGAADAAGLFYARSVGRGTPLTTPIPFGNNNAQAGHPALFVRDTNIDLVWKEFDGQRTVVRAQRSSDGGQSWSPAHTLATTTGRADHPQLIGHDRSVLLVWNTAQDGLRLIELTRP